MRNIRTLLVLDFVAAILISSSISQVINSGEVTTEISISQEVTTEAVDTVATEPPDDSAAAESTAKLPDSMADIVEAISNVQKNITEHPFYVNNLKVASNSMLNDSSSSLHDKPPANLGAEDEQADSELELYKPENMKPVLNKATTTSSDSVAEGASQTDSSTSTVTDEELDEEEANINALAEDEVMSAILRPPQTTIFSYDGAVEWFNWAVTMRDPQINPEGTVSWPVIIQRGFQGLVSYYNPFARSSRSISTSATLEALNDVYEHRAEIVEAILNDRLSPDVESIASFVRDLEKTKVSERISALSDIKQTKIEATEKQVIQTSPFIFDLTALSDLITRMFTPFATTTSSVKPDVKLVNSILKTIYMLLPLLYIPFSGIENFFLAPLPPNFESVPGFLRFLGIQAILGPDYVAEYDLGEIDDETAAAITGQDPADVPDVEDYEDDYVAGNRRHDKIRRKDQKETADTHSPVYAKLKPPITKYKKPTTPPSLPPWYTQSYGNVNQQFSNSVEYHNPHRQADDYHSQSRNREVVHSHSYTRNSHEGNHITPENSHYYKSEQYHSPLVRYTTERERFITPAPIMQSILSSEKEGKLDDPRNPNYRYVPQHQNPPTKYNELHSTKRDDHPKQPAKPEKKFVPEVVAESNALSESDVVEAAKPDVDKYIDPELSVFALKNNPAIAELLRTAYFSNLELNHPNNTANSVL